MVALSDPISFQPILSALARGWSWWVNEIEASLPSELRDRLFPPRSKLVVYVDEQGASICRTFGGITQVLGTILPESETDETLGRELAHLAEEETVGVTICIADTMILRRWIELPKAAEGRLRQVVKLDLDRQTPFPPDTIAFDVCIREQLPGTGRIRAELVVVRREIIDLTLTMLKRLRLEPRAVSMTSVENGVPEFNFLHDRKRRVRFSVRRHPWVSLMTLGVVLVLLNLGLAFWRLDTRIASLSAQLSTVRHDVQAAEKLRTELNQHTREAELLAATQTQAGALQVLDALTRLLPDDAWLARFDLGDKGGRIVGFAPSAADVVGRFEKSGLFTNPHFEAAVTRGQRPGEERFDISFELRQARSK